MLDKYYLKVFLNALITAVLKSSDRKPSLYSNLKERYQVEFADLHQLLSIQSDLLHVNGDREHRVGATAQTQSRETVNRTGVRVKVKMVTGPADVVNIDRTQKSSGDCCLVDYSFLLTCTWSRRS